MGDARELGATKVETEFGYRYGSTFEGLTVTTHAPDEQEVWGRDHVEFEASDERCVVTSSLDVTEVTQLMELLQDWLAARTT